jgi:putative endonuclease
MYWVYILYSIKLENYYAGSTNNVENRIYRHNNRQNKSTKSGVSWRLIATFECQTRAEAVKLEKKIKKRGIERYLHDIKFGV